MASEIIKGRKMVDESDLLDKLKSRDPAWLSIVSRLGVPSALLGVMMYLIYVGGMWVGQNIVKPLADRQIKFIDEVDESVRLIATTVKEHESASTVIAGELKKLNEKTEAGNVELKNVGSKLDKIETQLKDAKQ